MSNLDDKFILLAPRIQNVKFCEDELKLLSSAMGYERFKCALSRSFNLKFFELDLHREPFRKSNLVANPVFANAEVALQNLDLCVPRVNRDLVLTIAPHVHGLEKLGVHVNMVRCDDMTSLFQACSNVKIASFWIKYFESAEEALKHVTNLVQVAWSKAHLREFVIYWDAIQDLWKHSSEKQFLDEVSLVLQKMRPRRYYVKVNETTFFE